MGALLDAAALAACASIRSRARSLQDEDVSVDFAELTTPSDRVAVVVTEPLTRGRDLEAFAPGEMRVFVDGAPAPRG